MGDLNCNMTSMYDTNFRLLSDITDLYGLHQLINEPTRVTDTASTSLRRRRSKPSAYSVCELVHNIVFEFRRVARTYVGVINWLVSYVVCD